MRTVLLSPWRGGTTRRLCNNLNLIRRTPSEYESDKMKSKTGLVVNWGCSKVLGAGPMVLNPASAVAGASNKLSCLKKLSDNQIPTLEYTTEAEKARGWLKGSSVIAHFNLHAHSGYGLDLIKKGMEFSPSKQYKLFTRYFPKKIECRVHCIQDEDLKYKCMYLEKKRVKEQRFEEFDLQETPQTYIRTYENGWIFARGVSVNLEAVHLAAQAMTTCGLAYGAVDIMFNEEKYLVGEINTAPGLEGQALAFYVSHLGNMIERNKR